MEQIKDLLQEHDVAAFVVLHTPGFTEYLNKLSPSYSCVVLEGDGLRVRYKHKDDPKGKIAEGTYNLFSHFADITGMHALAFANMRDHLRVVWGAEDFDGPHTSHNQQNN